MGWEGLQERLRVPASRGAWPNFPTGHRNTSAPSLFTEKAQSKPLGEQGVQPLEFEGLQLLNIKKLPLSLLGNSSGKAWLRQLQHGGWGKTTIVKATSLPTLGNLHGPSGLWERETNFSCLYSIHPGGILSDMRTPEVRRCRFAIKSRSWYKVWRAVTKDHPAIASPVSENCAVLREL